MNTLGKKILPTIFMLICVIFFGNLTALAESNDFSVVPILPENQNADIESYFDLTVTPDQKQTLEVVIKNNTLNSQKYNIYINTATTNQNGIIDYSLSDFEKDDSMNVSLKDCIVLSTPQIEISGNSEKKVSFEINIPKKLFKGILLGGITIEPVTEEKEGINNVFTRTLAIQLSETDEAVDPDLKAGEVNISQDNYRNNVNFSLSNVSSTIISNVHADILITKKGKEHSIIEQKKEQLSFAPNSKFQLMTEWENQFEPGKYTYSIKISDDLDHNWTFKKNFEIKEKSAEKLNNTSVDAENKSSIKYIPYIIGTLIVGVLLFFFTLYKKKKSEHYK